MRTHLLEGKIRHRRTGPHAHALEHDVWYVALDLDEIDEVAARLRLVGRNRRGIVTFHDADHLPTPASDLPRDVRAHLGGEGFEAGAWRITLVTNLRILGYEFNPASFFLCRDERGALRVVVVEVHNTFGERHLYTLRPRDEDEPRARVPFTATMAKEFFVSPFLAMGGQYAVQVRDETDGLRVGINLRQGGETTLSASLVLRRLPLTDRSLLRMLLHHPLVTHKTMGMILWHAFRAWRRGTPFYRHGVVAGHGGLAR